MWNRHFESFSNPQHPVPLGFAEPKGLMATELERAIAEVREGAVAEVDLEEQEIDDAGATQLADALRTNTSVKKLGLRG